MDYVFTHLMSVLLAGILAGMVSLGEIHRIGDAVGPTEHCHALLSRAASAVILFALAIMSATSTFHPFALPLVLRAAHVLVFSWCLQTRLTIVLTQKRRLAAAISVVSHEFRAVCLFHAAMAGSTTYAALCLCEAACDLTTITGTYRRIARINVGAIRAVVALVALHQGYAYCLALGAVSIGLVASEAIRKRASKAKRRAMRPMHRPRDEPRQHTE